MKIFHISDLHFGMHHKFIIKPFLDDLAAIKPDIILISGDLTQRAMDNQYKEFLSFLEKISIKVCLVPGNHDVPLFNFFTRMFYPFKQYTRYVSANLSAEFENNYVKILGVNSVNPYRIKDGKLSSKTLHYINDYFESSSKGLNILFFHHNFDYLEGLHKPLENYQQFLSYLKESSIDIVCTGHSHYAHISLFEKANQQPCLFLHAGTLLCQRSKDGLNSYYLIETKKKGCKIDWRVFKNNSFNTITAQDIDFSKNYFSDSL
jgi:3',5'-cyclic AMP phosphodiesterase CpdA